MFKNYDFAIFQASDQKPVALRRFMSAFIDIVVLAVLLIYVWIPQNHPTLGELGADIAGFINAIVCLAVFYVPEILFRQTLGMWLMDIVVLVPPNKNPYKLLFIRKIVSLIELFTAPIYFLLVVFSKNHTSASDQIASCVLTRRPTDKN